MTLPRSPFAGDTNYFGATLQDLVAHLTDWRKITQETIDELARLRVDVVKNRDRLDEPESVLDFIDYMVNQFQRFLNDFGRIIRELPSSVEERHVELIRRLAERSRTLDQSCVLFKQEQIRRRLMDERLLSSDETGAWVRAGRREFADQSDRAVAAIYVQALKSLCDRNLVRHAGGIAYDLTGSGFQLARELKKCAI